MPKQVSETEWDQMVSVITAHPEGMKIDAISKCIKFDLSFRTLQRRLNKYLGTV